MVNVFCVSEYQRLDEALLTSEGRSHGIPWEPFPPSQASLNPGQPAQLLFLLHNLCRSHRGRTRPGSPQSSVNPKNFALQRDDAAVLPGTILFTFEYCPIWATKSSCFQTSKKMFCAYDRKKLLMMMFQMIIMMMMTVLMKLMTKMTKKNIQIK